MLWYLVLCLSTCSTATLMGTLFGALGVSSPISYRNPEKTPCSLENLGEVNLPSLALFNQFAFWFCCSSRSSTHATRMQSEWILDTPTTDYRLLRFCRFVLFIWFSPIERYSSLPPKFSGALFLCVDLLRFCFDFKILVVSCGSVGSGARLVGFHRFRISTDRTGPIRSTRQVIMTADRIGSDRIELLSPVSLAALAALDSLALCIFVFN